MRVLLFDLDNTILRCNEAYRAALAGLVERVQSHFPTLPAEEIRTHFHAIHRQTLLSADVARDSYPRDLVQAYREICNSRGFTPEAKDEAHVREVGYGVYRYDYAPYPGALEMLKRYRAAGWRMALYTKGVPEVQRPKIERWGLEKIFHEIRLTPRKHAAEMLSLVETLAPEGAAEAWMIGDSLRDDILAAREAGLNAVLIEVSRGSSYDEGCAAEPHHTLADITELPELVPPE